MLISTKLHIIGLTSEYLEDYSEACDRILEVFVLKYYCDAETGPEDVDTHWVGNQTGGVAEINDDFWSMDNIVLALELDCPGDTLWGWHDYCYERYSEGKEPEYNLGTWMKKPLKKP